MISSSFRTSPHRASATPLRALLVLLAWSAAFLGVAQEEREVGTLELAIDGRTVTWTLTAISYDDGSSSASASWSPAPFTGVSVTIEAFGGRASDGPGGTIVLSIAAPAFPTDCPCTLVSSPMTGTMVDLDYVPTSFGDGYYSTGDGGSLEWTFTVLESLADPEGAYRVEATFTGTLVFVASLGGDADPSNTVQIEGTLIVDPLLRIEF